MSDENLDPGLKKFIEQEANVNVEESEESTDSASDVSFSEKIIIESNQKRLCKRMTSLQNSINNLKEQFQQEKQHWKDDLEKLKILQQQQQNIRSMCSMSKVFSHCHNSCNCDNSSRTNSIYSLISHDCSHTNYDTSSQQQRSEQKLIFFDYKQKLIETENMCNLELIKLKQSLQELKHLETLTLDLDKTDKTENKFAEEIE